MLSDFASWIGEQIAKVLQWLFDLYASVLEWFLQVLEWIPKKIWSELLGGLATAFEAIPAPDFMREAGNFFGNIPSSVVYFFQFFAVAEGVGMIISALVLRFILRRIPLIG